MGSCISCTVEPAPVDEERVKPRVPLGLKEFLQPCHLAIPDGCWKDVVVQDCPSSGTGGSRDVATSSSGTVSGSTLCPLYSGSGRLQRTNHIIEFRAVDLARATGNYHQDRRLGQGGFGEVYRGRIPMPRHLEEGGSEGGKGGNATELVVAVKKLSEGSQQGLTEWQKEVEFLGGVGHPNLVKLVGYCLHPPSLVYEFMPLGSFNYHIFSPPEAPTLSFQRRLRVLIGAARGLQYLHEGCGARSIIFRDFKTSNILLDKDYNAKLSDFGFARYGPEGSITHISTDVVGTSNYIAPEYFTTGHLTHRCDVYSFGVVLLETLSGRKAGDSRRLRVLVARAQELALAARWPGARGLGPLVELMDARLESKYSEKAASILMKLALDCVRSDPQRRPAMGDAVKCLLAAEIHAQRAAASSTDS